MKKRLPVYGSLAGLAMGVVMFWIAMLPTFTEETILYQVYDVFNRPVLWLVGWMHQTFHGSGLYELLTAFLCYWGLLGFLGGFGCWRLCARRHTSPNKVTGANVGGPGRFRVRMHWAARVAQFCR